MNPSMHGAFVQFGPHGNEGDGVHLTDREVQVLECVAEGLTNKEAGHLLQVTEGTIKTHLLRIYEKLGANDRTEAVVKAFRLRLISL